MKTLQNKIFATLPGLIWGLCAGFVMLTGQLSAAWIPKSAKVKTDAAGNALAVWELQGEYTTIIQAAYRSATSQAWSTPEQLSPTNSKSVDFKSYDPKFAINSAGQAIAIWRSVDPTSLISRIYAATISLQGSSTWTPAISVSNPTEPVQSLYQEPPYSVSLSENGQAIVLWPTTSLEFKSSTSTISDGTNTWSTPVLVVGTSNTSNDKQQ